MAYKFNPFTDTLDIVGSGGGSYIDGEVEYHSSLPVTAGTPAVNSAFLVRKGEGLYFISRKPAGIWVRELNNGNLDDWKYAGTFSDLYRDANFRIISDSDPSKELAFSLSGIATGTTRTLTVPNASGTIARTEDFASPPAIGNTTPAAGSFTTLNATTSVTVTGPIINTLTGNQELFTSAGASLFSTTSNGATLFVNRPTNFGTNVSAFGHFRLVASNGADPIIWEREGNGVVGQRNTTNPQTFRLYNTFTDASNHERGFLRWSSNVFQIGTEKGGTGSARALEFQTDGVTRMTLATNGDITAGGFIIGATTITATSAGRTYETSAGSGFGNVTSGTAMLAGSYAVRWAAFSNGLCGTRGDSAIGWSSSGGPSSSNIDTRLWRDAAGIVAIRNGATGQAFRIYNTDGTDFERLNFRWASNEFIIDAEAGGSGTLRGIKIGSATSSLLGFYGVTPVDQPATVTDPTGVTTDEDVEARTAINAIIDRLQELGLIA